MNKIKKLLLNIWYGLPFGMKAADGEIMGSGDNTQDGISITKQTSDERVGKHLLKGEVTQAVEELRYRTYKVANESENYNYIGNGVAIKEKKRPTNDSQRTRFKFYQENKNICESVLETLKQVDNTDYSFDKYTLEIDYENLVRFKLEKYAKSIFVNIDEDKKIIETTLNFSVQPNPYDTTSRPFINALEQLTNVSGEYAISRNEIASSVKNIAFSTYHASNERDFVNYCFVNGGKFKGIVKTNDEYHLTFEWDEYMRVPLNLESKYYSKTMAEKYEKQEKKDSTVSLSTVERKAYCSVCGKEVPIYDADIQKANGQEILCQKCMEKLLSKENNIL